MSDKTGIQWTEATWNPVVGCSLKSPACANCYAMSMAARIERMHAGSHYAGTTQASKAGPVWTGKMVLAPDHILLQPLRWKRPRTIFVNSMGDLFHEDVPDEWIDKVFAVMALAPQHTFQVLTKRSDRMRDYCNDPTPPDRIDKAMDEIAPAHWHTRELQDFGGWPLSNVWLGISAEDQRRADERVPDLLATPAAMRFVSAEPLLGPIDFGEAWHGEPALDSECWGDCAWCAKGYPALHNCQRGLGDWKKGRSGLDWIIVGGESGPGARPMHPGWARSIRDQCAAADVAFFFKQHGEWIGVPDLRRLPGGGGPGFGAFDHCQHDMGAEAVRVGKSRAGRLLDGVEHNAMPVVPHG